MKLIHIIEGMWPINVGERHKKQYIYYIDMDGVLVDLQAGLRGAKTGWKTPEALIEKIGSATDPAATRDFYLSLRKTKEADAIWEEASQLAQGNIYILTVAPDIAGLAEAKMEWVMDNISPLPRDVLIVKHRQKSQYARGPESILVDDDISNIERWVKAGGSGILHIPGAIRSTIQRMQVPEGKPDVEVDMTSQEGIPTTPQLFRGGGRAGQKAKYTRNKVDYHMRINNLHLQIPDIDQPLEILSVLSADDIAVEVIKRFKAGNLSRPQIAEFIDESAESVAVYTQQNYTDTQFDNIIVPQSKSKVATIFATAIAKKLKIANIIHITKNTDANTVQINQAAAEQVADTYNTLADTPQRKLSNTNYPKNDIKRYQWKPEDVIQRWRKQVQEWINDTRSTKQLDPLLRRNNLSNLYTPPDNFEDMVGGRCNLIVDDVTTYHMTIADIAKTLVDHNSLIEVGVVLWMV